MPPSEASGSGSDEGLEQQPNSIRKIRVHKFRQTAPPAGANDAAHNAMIDRKIAELIPGIADLSVSEGAQKGALKVASSIRQKQQQRDEVARAQAAEMAHIFDMSRPHALDNAKPENWSQTLRPPPRRVVLSSYQAEMINYQRMHLRKNIWYYRDRLNNARGPAPLHVLKEAWVQGIIDENTLVWGQGLVDWLPAKNVKLLLPMIRTPEVRLGAWMKRTFSLKPALNRIREARKDTRDPEQLSKQVEAMR
mmetsp:Transcript_2994/g.7392  ORF Transcript_2994/g.7392 Transcript_2994/m.7392 type:complete len:250 (-) Transcript_2994:586-1335(-)